VDPMGLRNLWNPLTWDQPSDPEQTWLGFVNPAAQVNREVAWAYTRSGAKTVASVPVAATAVSHDALNKSAEMLGAKRGYFGSSDEKWNLAYRWGPHGQLEEDNAPK
jgi:hypothetical protein